MNKIISSEEAKKINGVIRRREVFDSMNKIMLNLLDTNLRGTWTVCNHRIDIKDLEDDQKFSELMGDFYKLILSDILYGGGSLTVDGVESSDINNFILKEISDYIGYKIGGV